MEKRGRVRDYGLTVGNLVPGRYNAITDVPGVAIGHQTLITGEGRLIVGEGPVRTGVTAIKPHNGNMFREKLVAASHIINGYGKSIGLAQIEELGLLETPILLTNTLNVGRVADSLLDYMIEQAPEIGITASTVNPVVCECNDSYLNDIQGRHVGREQVFSALNTASSGPVAEGGVGAGTGMSCFGFKGGIGTASRLIRLGREQFTLAALLLSNFGQTAELIIAGVPVGRELLKRGLAPRVLHPAGEGDGSVIIIIATDLILTARQLGRVARRAALGLSRVGSYVAHGSGDFVLAFSTGFKYPAQEQRVSLEKSFFNEDRYINTLFQATVEVTEEAVLNSLFTARTVVGRDNHCRESLPINDVLDILSSYHALAE